MESRNPEIPHKLHTNTPQSPTSATPSVNGSDTVVTASGTEITTSLITNDSNHLLNPGVTNPLTSRSPPPAYDAVLLSKTSPPSYEEATNRIPAARNEGVPPEAEPETEEDSSEDLYNTCECSSCQGQYTYQGENDIVFPMETHVLMQEVLADGMAFCSLM